MGMVTSFHDSAVRPRVSDTPCGDIATLAFTRGSRAATGGVENVFAPATSMLVKAP
jgi:hypothetical protein